MVAVAAVDLEIARGEFFTMLGPSGSGKTTTLRMVAGFEQPDAGLVELAGRDVTGLPPYDREVNTVFQDYALFPHMTVAENVEYGMRVQKVPRAERARRASEALEMVRLPGYRVAQAGRALGRPAPAGRAGPRDRQPPAGAAARRAAGSARPEAPRADAGGAEGDPERGRDHLHLRHPRPGRGADDERPDRGPERGTGGAGGIAGRDLRAAGDPVRDRLRGRLQHARARRQAIHGAAREDQAAGARPRRAPDCTPSTA